MRRLVKTKELKLRLNPEDAAALDLCARLESNKRREIVGATTLLRELGMPMVRQRLAELQAAAA